MRWGTHLGRLQAPYLPRLRVLPWFVPRAGKKDASQRLGVHLCASAELGFELSLGPSFLPAHMPPGELWPVPLALSKEWPGRAGGSALSRHSPYTDLEDEAGLVLEGREFPTVGGSHAVMLVSFEPMNQACSF